jgi:hypothetical protein
MYSYRDWGAAVRHSDCRMRCIQRRESRRLNIAPFARDDIDIGTDKEVA